MKSLTRAVCLLAVVFLAGCSAPIPDEGVESVHQAEEGDLPENSLVLDQTSLPSELFCGEERAVYLRFINTGVSSWELPTHFLGAAVDDHDPLGGPGRVELPIGPPPESIEPGETVTFDFTLHAPEEPGHYTTSWRMVHEHTRWFGATASREVHVTCDGPQTEYSELSTDDVPEEIFCDRPFVAHVVARNVGDTTWHGPGNGRQGVELRRTPESAPFGPTVFKLPANSEVAPLEEHEFTLALHSPAAPDLYPLKFRMFNVDRQAWFGPTLTRNVQVTCTNDAATPVSWSLPSSVACGDPYPIQITFKNTGVSDWTTAAGYRLGNPDPHHYFFPLSLRRVDIPGGGPIRRNEQTTFSFVLRAPYEPHPAYVQAWKMVHDGDGGFFGPSVSQVVDVRCDPYAAELVNFAVADTLSCGQNYTANVVLRNRGSQTWRETEQFVALAGGLGPASVRFPPGTAVAPGQTYAFSFPIAAPYGIGLRYGRWQLAHDGSGPFGPIVGEDISLDCQPRDARLESVVMQGTQKCSNDPSLLVTVKNTGYLTWSRSSVNGGFTRLVALPTSDWQANPIVVAVAPNDYVRPGDTYSFQVSWHRVPGEPSPLDASPGWRMAYDPPPGQGGGGFFGAFLPSHLRACQ